MIQERNPNPPIEPRTLTSHTVTKGIAGVAGLFLLGFLLGFFPTFLSDKGTLAKAVDHGWKFSLILVGATIVSGLLYVIFKRMSLPDLAISMILFMVTIAMINTLGGIVTENSRPWQNNLLSGLGSGAMIGASVYWVQRRRGTHNAT